MPIHKKILGGIGAVAGIAKRIGIPGAGVVSTIASVLGGRDAQKQRGLDLKFNGDVVGLTGGELGFGGPLVVATGPCKDPALVRSADGHCVAPGSGHYLSHFGGATVGNAVMGKYGAALIPGSMIIDRAICLRGMQLGDDGLCYNKAQIQNKQRMWPAGRKPLLSGGDMRAISTAARAGRRLEGATKRLQRMGMMKKAAPRRIAPPQHQRLLEAHVT